MFVTVGHHTFENRNKHDDINHSPYRATGPDKFLGDGFYFWEDNLDLAKYWGGVWYINKGMNYHVISVTIRCSREFFFDLVGERSHQNLIKKFSAKLAVRRPGTREWPIGKVIAFLSAASKDPEQEVYNKFQYTVFRAADDSHNNMAEKVKFAGNQPNYANLNPAYIICVKTINDIDLSTKSLQHSSEKAF